MPAPTPTRKPQPKPIPKPYQLRPHTRPAPKASQPQQHEPSEAEWAAFGRSIYAAKVAERKAYQAITEARQEQNQLLAEMGAKVGGAIVDECEFCHSRHEGPCNA